MLPYNHSRLPPALQVKLQPIPEAESGRWLAVDRVYQGDAREVIPQIAPNSIAVSVWSPLYYVGKSYERNLTFEAWQKLLCEVIQCHFRVIKPGGFLAINIADILCFRDESMPKIQAANPKRNRSQVSREDVLLARRCGNSRQSERMMITKQNSQLSCLDVLSSF